MTPFLSNYTVERDPADGAYYFLDPDSGQYVPFTPAMNQQALDLASEQALDAVGLYGIPKNEWTGQDAKAYITTFRELVLNYSERFTPETVAIARGINLSRVNNYAGYDPNALIDLDRFVADVTTATNDAFMTIASPLAQIPTTLSNGLTSILTAVEKTAKGLANTSALGEYLVPIALIGFLWFALRSVGQDPAGQFAKGVGAFR